MDYDLEVEKYFSDLKSQSIDNVDYGKIHNRLIKGKVVEYTNKDFERVDETKERVRVNEIKINELKAVRKFLCRIYGVYSHSEIKDLINITDNLLREQNEFKEINEFEVSQIKKLIEENKEMVV